MDERYYVPVDIRFWQKVKFGEGMDDCWEWTGFCYPSGHGQFHLPGRGDVKASRAAWLIYNGPLDRTDYICHRCDNPKCVRLDHLYKGTHASNQADKARANVAYRAAFGTLPLRRSLSARKPGGQPGPRPQRSGPPYAFENATYVKLNWSMVDAIRAFDIPAPPNRKEIQGHLPPRMYSAGEVALMFNISPRTVLRIWRGDDRGGWRREVLTHGD